jgi:hypothetical protein
MSSWNARFALLVHHLFIVFQRTCISSDISADDLAAHGQLRPCGVEHSGPREL